MTIFICKYPSLLPALQMTAEQLTCKYNTMHMSSKLFSDIPMAPKNISRGSKKKKIFIYI
jgi:hypothetical protein